MNHFRTGDLPTGKDYHVTTPGPRHFAAARNPAASFVPPRA